MPSKKKKYNARFPAGRIKKIMQTDEDVGKVAQAVPVIISRTLELFVESLLKRAMQITSAKNAKTLTPSHMKQCILSESRFDFLKDLVKGIPDVSNADDEPGTFMGAVTIPNPTSTKSPTDYGCFQFRRKSDGGVSRPSTTASQHSSVSQAVLPNFYKEISIGGDGLKNEEEGESASGRAVTQHAGSRVNHKTAAPAPNNDHYKSPTINLSLTSSSAHTIENKITNCITNENRNTSSDEEAEDDDEDELKENGYHRLEIVTKTCAIDEDYDT